MKLQRVKLLLAIILALCVLIKGVYCLDVRCSVITYQFTTGLSSSCSSLDELISNVNTSELSQCRRQDDCSAVECQNQNGQLRRIVEVFDFRLLPCAEPSPVVWLQLLGQRDPIHDNQRSVQLSVNLTGSIQHEVRLGGLPLGVYNFTITTSQPSSSVGIEVRYCLHM